ncbi:MAG: hypothetical protein VBE63_26610 [Lamprobacter sp.]|uniref:hypothetical protein n=1 Tax=Lamprobacter sp. TaxID=3100796 RepID=UPI002B259204|nr:hypothetical protein [Lamprobacter sp.]MEA3643477.1 hypothetical protein [Lamprobacter sp.]
MMTSLHATSGLAAELLLSLDYRGDRLQRLSDAPTLSIFDDGAVRMPQLYQHTQAYDYSLSDNALEQLLATVTAQGFFEPDFDLGIPGSTAPVTVSHASTTILYVQHDDAERTVSVNDLRHRDGAQGLRIILRELEHLMAMIKLGGESVVRDWLEQANAELAQHHPGLPPLDLGDLASGAKRGDGSVSLVFARESDGVRVSLSVDAQGNQGVSVSP